MARTPFTLKPFINIRPGAEKPSEDPEMLEKLKQIDKLIEDAKRKKEEFSATASELQRVNHPESQEAWLSVAQADNILARLIALRYDTLDGK